MQESVLIFEELKASYYIQNNILPTIVNQYCAHVTTSEILIYA